MCIRDRYINVFYYNLFINLFIYLLTYLFMYLLFIYVNYTTATGTSGGNDGKLAILCLYVSSRMLTMLLFQICIGIVSNSNRDNKVSISSP